MKNDFLTKKDRIEKRREKEQRTLDYALYMMTDFLFKKAGCITPYQEEKLFLSYQELKEDDKERIERIASNIIKKRILPVIPSDMLDEKVSISLVGSDKELCTEILIKGSKELVAFTVEKLKGKYRIVSRKKEVSMA